MKSHRSIAVAGLFGALAIGVTACGSDGSTDADAAGSGSGSGPALSGTLAGAGASSQQAAQQAWIAGFQTANEDVTVSYDPVGSGGGREQFIAGGVAFAGSDSALKEEELTGAQKRCGGPDNLVEVPIYVSPIAVAYNLDGVKDLQLSPETLAGIFKGTIKVWNDPAIVADNPGAKLPDTRITAVHRSDDSGTTDNFTDYLNKTAPSVWTDEADGEWPIKGGEAAEGTSGVIDAITNGAGSIGYADESQARELGIAKIKVGDAYVAPSAEAAAAVVDASKEKDDAGKYVFTYDLARDTTDSGTYPVVLVSYGIACTKYDDAAQGSLTKGYLQYIVSADGQKAAQDTAGSAPLSSALTQKITPAVAAIGGAQG